MEEAAKSVGKEIEKGGETHQVICITHQPVLLLLVILIILFIKNTIDGGTATAVKT